MGIFDKLNLNLKQKLIVILVILVMVPLLVFGGISYNRQRKSIKSQVIENNRIFEEYLGKEIKNYISDNQKLLQYLAADKEVRAMDSEAQKRLFQKFKKQYPLFEIIYATDVDGGLTGSSTEVAVEDYDEYSYADREWYQIPLEKENFISETAYISRETNNLCLTISVPIKRNGEVVGVLGGDINLQKLQELIANADIENNGNAYLVDGAGTLIAHENYKRVSNQEKLAANPVVSKILEGQNGTQIYETKQGTEMLAAYEALEGLGWGVVVQQPVDKAFAGITNVFKQTVILILATIGLAVLVSVLISRSIADPIVKASQFAQQIADGNLDLEELDVEGNDEVNNLAAALNNMRANLRDIIVNVKETIEDLSAYSEELSASAEEGNASVEQTKENIEQLAQGIEQVSANSEQVSSLAEEVENQIGTGDENVAETVTNINEINQEVSRAVEVIHQLDDYSGEIGQIVELIENISEQTNLLALNAAIEAARAGGSGEEGGQGFAVVAEEIRELAEESTAATDKIADIVNKIQEESDEGLQVIEEVDIKAETGKEIVQETGEIFKEINRAIDNTTEQIENTVAITQQLAANSSELEGAAEDVAQMSEEITNSSQELANMTQELQGLIEEFKL